MINRNVYQRQCNYQIVWVPESRVLEKRWGKKLEKELKEKFKGAYVEASGFQSKLVSQLSLHRATSIL